MLPDRLENNFARDNVVENSTSTPTGSAQTSGAAKGWTSASIIIGALPYAPLWRTNPRRKTS